MLYLKEILYLPNDYYNLYADNQTLSNNHKDYIENCLTFTSLKIRCFLNLLYPKYSIRDIPFKVRKNIKVHGEFLLAVFNLCVNTHGIQIKPEDRIFEYKNATEWFIAILREMIEVKINWYNNSFEIPENVTNRDKKRYLLNIYSAELTKLSRFENPYRNTDLIHLSYLMDCALKRSAEVHDFKKNFLNAYIKKGREKIKAYTQPDCQRLEIDKKGRPYTYHSGTNSKKYVKSK